MAFLKEGAPQAFNVIKKCSVCANNATIVVEGESYCDDHKPALNQREDTNE